jgi:hypothetical protein
MYHLHLAVNLLDQFQEKSSEVLAVKILQNLDTETKNNLELVALMIHTQKH